MLKSGEFRRATVIAAALLVALVAVLVLWGVRPAEAAFPGANGKIAFSSNRVTTNNPEGDLEIFAMNPDRTGLEQLTDNSFGDFHPAWSANGRSITWLSFVDHVQGEIYMRYPLAIPGGDIFVTKRLTTNTAGDSSPSFNHDGTKIAFVSNRDGNEEIYVMDTVDSNNDGNGDNPTNLTNLNTASDTQPAFSPDGTRIAFVSNRDGNTEGDYEIYVMDSNPNTNDTPTNLTNNAAEDVNPTWSPDGSKIAFTSFRDGNLDIYVMDSDGTDQKRRTKNAADDFSPAWSPDGTRIAFTSVRGGGDSEIYVMKASRPESKRNRPKNLTNNNVSDLNPDWRPIVQP